MRTRVWCMSLVLAALGVACGDQTTEVNVDQQVAPGSGMAGAPGVMADATATSDDGLDIVLEDQPATHEPHTWWVPVGEDGTFSDSTYVVDVGDLDVTFTLTATSRASGRSLAVQFTDANISNDVVIDPNPAFVQRGNFVDLTITVSFGGNAVPCTANLSVSGLSTPTTGEFTPTSVTGTTGETKTSTLRITTTAGSPLGPDGFTVTAATGTGCTGTNRTGTGTVNVHGPATKLAFAQQPTNEESATPIAPAVQVSVLDASNNVAGSVSASIALAIGTNPGGGILSGTLSQSTVNGVATFADLSIDKIGTGYTLVASSTGLTGATSSAFNITLGPAAKLAFFTQPSGGAPNTAFATQPRVEVQDAGGNRRTSGAGSASSITLAIVPGSGAAGAALTCTTNPLAASAGLATFAGCRINLTGTTYRLRATSGSLTAADSDPFNITPTNQPPNVNAGGPYTVKEGTELTLTPTVTDPDGDALTYHWDVDSDGIDTDGTCTFDSQSAKNAKVTCTDDSDDAADAKFTLTLTVDDGTAPPVSDNADLKVTNENPIADAGGPYASAAEGSPIQLGGSGDDPGDNDDSHLGYHWMVDDTGITSGGSCEFDNAASKNAKITCDDNGSATVSLVVSDDDGGTSVASTATLSVTNADPVANAGPDYDGDEGEVIQLNGTVSDVGANDVLTWSWAYAPGANVDPGAECTFSDENAIDPTISCTDDGEVTLTLKVEDDDFGEDTDTAILTLANVAPVASAGGPYSGAVEGTAINLSGSATDAGTNDSHTFQWTVDDSGIDDGGSCSIDDATEATTTITCNDNGTLKVSLVATDDDGGVSLASQATISIANVNPEITAFTKSDGTPLPTTLIVAGTLGLKAPFGDDGTNDTHQVEVDCGSGTFSPAVAITPGLPATGSCNFPTIGPKTIRLKVADDDADATQGYHIVSHPILVKYDFDGFYAPVDRPNTMNVSKAGQAIPLKWTLRNATGAPVTDLATVTVKTVAMSCDQVTTTDPLEEYAGSTSGLLNLGDGRYQYNWKTVSTYAGTCKSIALVFAAGGVSYTEGPHAFFSFKK
jgi:PKD domain